MSSFDAIAAIVHGVARVAEFVGAMRLVGMIIALLVEADAVIVEFAVAVACPWLGADVAVAAVVGVRIVESDIGGREIARGIDHPAIAEPIATVVICISAPAVIVFIDDVVLEVIIALGAVRLAALAESRVVRAGQLVNRVRAGLGLPGAVVRAAPPGMIVHAVPPLRIVHGASSSMSVLAGSPGVVRAVLSLMIVRGAASVSVIVRAALPGVVVGAALSPAIARAASPVIVLAAWPGAIIRAGSPGAMVRAALPGVVVLAAVRPVIACGTPRVVVLAA